MSRRPASVKIVEVGPRDGLQNENQPLSPQVKAMFIDKLADAGVAYIEAGSFVNPKWVPQMASSEEVFATIARKPGVTYAALTPNIQGFERAMDAGASEVAVFAAASEAFSEKNINCSIEASLQRFAPLMEAANQQHIPVRGYLSCVLGCPYEGAVEPGQVADVAAKLIELGCYEVSLGDTIGIGTPATVGRMLETVEARIKLDQVAVHFHDTYGMAIANICTALDRGIAVVDSSVSGLGGCPYAEGASGNVATEDVVYLLDGFGIEHGLDLEKLIEAGAYINGALERRSGSRVAQAKSKVH